MAALSDQMLITQVTVFGSRRAYDTLVQRHQASLRQFLLSLTGGDGMLSDDLAQDSFVKAWLQLNTFKNKSSFKTWLFRIAYNVFYDYIRSRKEVQSIEDVETEVNSFYKQQANDGSLSSDIQQAMQLLSANERTCITLFYLDSLQIKDIASVLNMPEGTVKSHLARGKEKMTTFLKQNGYE
ncbi:MAG: RNA polymerase sigma factor [Bacteroidaceae bacterium]|nr:RNA polymerase sigma factor [Bacteroidaceae bacterium]MBO4589967.1 RNA polymerase sigma factor [Bacteroidaceae bacterium]MBR5963854.1 RNA polymerase sigma factor [Bacteroidaceae bacterium]